MEYCERAWHTAHLPMASTNASLGCWIASLGRARLMRKAATINEKEITTAIKTGRKYMRACSGVDGVELFAVQEPAPVYCNEFSDEQISRYPVLCTAVSDPSWK